MPRARGSRARRGRGRGRGRPKAQPVEPEESEEETKTDDESTSEDRSSESTKKTNNTKKKGKKDEKTKDKSPPPPSSPREVEFPKGLGKRKTISFGFHKPSPKRQVLSLSSHCNNIPIHLDQNEEERVKLDIENNSKDEDESTFIREGQSNFATDIALWLEKNLQIEHENDKKLFTADQGKAHLSLDERIRYECANG